MEIMTHLVLQNTALFTQLECMILTQHIRIR